MGGTPLPRPPAPRRLLGLGQGRQLPERLAEVGGHLLDIGHQHRVAVAANVEPPAVGDGTDRERVAVNERDGFLAGDAMLRQAAERLRQASVDAALLARLGGDELVAIFVGGQAVADAEAVAAVVAGPGAPGMRAAAVAAIAAEPAGSLIERAYAAMRRS